MRRDRLKQCVCYKPVLSFFSTLPPFLHSACPSTYEYQHHQGPRDETFSGQLNNACMIITNQECPSEFGEQCRYWISLAKTRERCKWGCRKQEDTQGFDFVFHLVKAQTERNKTWKPEKVDLWSLPSLRVIPLVIWCFSVDTNIQASKFLMNGIST